MPSLLSDYVAEITDFPPISLVMQHQYLIIVYNTVFIKCGRLQIAPSIQTPKTNNQQQNKRQEQELGVDLTHQPSCQLLELVCVIQCVSIFRQTLSAFNSISFSAAFAE